MFPSLIDPAVAVVRTDPVPISRREVERGDIAPLMARLSVFMADREAVWRHRSQVVLAVDGFDGDHRDLVDIAEVRIFFRVLDAQWPEWAYFLDPRDGSMKLLLCSVAGRRFLGKGVVDVDLRRVRASVERALQAMARLFQRFGLPADELAAMCHRIYARLQAAELI
jgi:hypothetical protein